VSTQIYTDIHCIAGIGEYNSPLRGEALGKLAIIENGYLVIEDDRVAGMGSMQNFPHQKKEGFSLPPGTFVLPTWCDSHTHLVFANSRENEFVDKVGGLTYEEIAKRGGGILNSARSVESASEDELFATAWNRLTEVSKMGTGAIEIKSGYGLSVKGEIKILRVIKKLKEKSNLEIKATFLGAHAFPGEYKNNHEGYIKLIIDEMLPLISTEGLADYIDVFCEKGFFSPEEMEKICMAGKQYGLQSKLHVNQMHSIGGIEAGIRSEALSLDHLETLTEKEIQLLGQFKGCATLLPTAAFFLRMQYPPARKLIETGASVTLASDYNPGSSPSGNMFLVVAMACIQMRMFPGEAINAATINGAFAMGIAKDYGSIGVGKKANLIFTKPVSSLAYIPYAFGSNLVEKVMINGTII
jgi:imidazolonepropionase